MTAAHRSRPRAEPLEHRRLLTGYLPAVADYDGDGVADIAMMRVGTNGTQQVYGKDSLLMQLSKSRTLTGYEMGYAAGDTPTPADFDGDGKADPAVYGFLDATGYENYYGTTTTPFPNGTGRFAYIPSSGVYPTHDAGAVDGTMGLINAQVIVVNIGDAGDIPAVADYTGDGRADFAVYEPSKAQFLYYDSATFNPNADPTLPGNAPIAVPLGQVGDVPASADYAGIGHAQFAVYDAATGTFTVLSPDGKTTSTVQLGGPGDIPVSADYEGIGRADFAVYDPSKGVFLVRPSDGSAVRTVAIGSIGDEPIPAKFGDGRVDFATFTPSTQTFQYIQFPSGTTTKSLGDPNDIPIERTDAYSVGVHAADIARTASPDVMFLGDSITYNWPLKSPETWSGPMAQYNPSDNGDVADATQNVLWRVENGELAVHPQVVVLNVGTNDFVDRTPAQVADTIGVLMAQIHLRSPGTRILLLDVFPRGEDSTTDTPLVQEFDTGVAADIRVLDQQYIPELAPPLLARTTGGYVTGDASLNLQSVFSADPADPNDYYANPADFLDLLHPNDHGYQLELAALAEPLRLMLHRSPVPGDYNGDGRTDLAIYAPGVAAFAVRSSLTGTDTITPYGLAGPGQTLMAAGDYDGDGRTDLAVYEPSLGAFLITSSSTGATSFIPFGIKGAGQSIPAPGDYDGDGRTDLAVYEPSLGSFVLRGSASGATVTVPFGIKGAGQSIPVPGDYDGDGRTDLAVYLPALGAYAYRPSSGGPDVIVPFGVAGIKQSIPVPGDYDGIGRTELGVYLPADGLFIYRSLVTGTDVVRSFGAAGIGQAIPAPGDYDGDGKSDLAIYGPTVGGFAIVRSSTGAAGFDSFGVAGYGNSIPATSSYDFTTGTPLGGAAPVAAVPHASATKTTVARVSAASTIAPATRTKTRTAPADHPHQPAARVAQATPTGPAARVRHRDATASV